MNALNAADPGVVELPGAEFLTDEERAALASAGYGRSMGIGARPALLVVDVTYAFCGHRGSSLAEAVSAYPLACGPAAWEAIPTLAGLVDAARHSDVPVFFTRGAPSITASRWSDKNARHDDAPRADARDIVQECGFREQSDVLLEKEGPSAFFGTPLTRHLIGLGVDSVVVAGTTTSGCVRATVVDAFTHNFKVAVAADACFDRVGASHRMSLFDMGLKYADVLSSARLIQLLGGEGGAS
ncbi:isochorismatase family protein [Nocardioides daejeonensis]|uniref:isochorismatase family protein n=1 Tax=Nocardioides daejeonensis TaxID=1046556 RepID=UPI000D74E331|nr:isochorismatase family protein [Nocardioides daejeonensis]